jgi:electron transport complex protein RnfC
LSPESLTLPKPATFPSGGIHPAEEKEVSSRWPTEVLPPPQKAVIPVSQHLGGPCEPIVKKGDQVKVGTVIASSKLAVSALIHSTVSGTVKEIEHRPHPLGARVLAIEITPDGKDEWEAGIDRSEEIVEPDYGKPTGWIDKVRQAGVVGMGGAGFPTHIKLSPPPGKKIDTVIFNGAECEPYLTADHRLMLEHPREILIGCRIMQTILGAETAILGIEDNKPDAIDLMKKTAEEIGGIAVVTVRTRYPQGGEKQLIEAILGRQVPSRGLPMDVGVVVDNVGTCFAVYQAVVKNRPLIDRVLTVGGPGVAKPRNFLVRLGTPFSEVLAACGIVPGPGEKVVMGGPMMGHAVRRLDVPVVKVTSGILIFPKEVLSPHNLRPCIRCGRCVEVCPVGLVPTELAALVQAKKIGPLDKMGVHDCIECGCCAYDCPAYIDLVHWIRLGKFEASSG